MAALAASPKLHQIFTNAYEEHMLLGHWLRQFNIQGLQQEGDTPSYRYLLETTVIAFRHERSSHVHTPIEYSTLLTSNHDLFIQYIIDKIYKEQSDKNVLTMGFAELSDYSADQTSTFQVSYRHTNQNVSLLQHSSWRTLVSRVGDQIAIHMLLSASLFTKATSSSCYIQITGLPIYGLILPELVSKGKATVPVPMDMAPIGQDQPRVNTMVNEYNTKMKESAPFDHNVILQSSVLLRNFPLTEKISPTLSLNQLTATSAGTTCLFTEMCNTSVFLKDEKHVLKASDKETISRNLQPILRKLISAHRSFPFKYYLNVHCPVPAVSGTTAETKTTTRHGNVTPSPSVCQPKPYVSVTNHLNKPQILLFLRKFCRKVIPVQLTGNKENFNRLLKHVKKLLSLGKLDKLSLGEVMSGMKVTACSWLSDISSHLAKVTMLARVLWWLLSVYIITVIQSFFFTTEMVKPRNKLFMYRKVVWFRVNQRMQEEMLAKGHLAPVSLKEVKLAIIRGETLGVSTLRFLPKPPTFRPIVNLGKSVMVPGIDPKYMVAVNKQLGDVQQVLTYIRKTSPGVFGSSVLGSDDVYVKWKAFVKARLDAGDERPLCFLKTDVERAYDSMSQKKLQEIVTYIMNHMEVPLVMRKVAVISLVNGRSTVKFRSLVGKLEDYTANLNKFVNHLAKTEHIQDAIIIDQSFRDVMFDSMLKKLDAHLFNNFIKMGQNYYRQMSGISQGSVISTLLCNLYYSVMEMECFPPLLPGELLMRMVDDFLFVSPHRERAEELFGVLSRGIAEYNCHTNEEKTCVNFELTNLEGHSPQMLISGEPIPWCGLLFDPGSLNVTIDYSRYDGISISDTLTFDVSNKPGELMRQKLQKLLMLKNQRIVLDSEINVRANVILSSYHILVLTGLRFHAMADKLPYKKRVIDNPDFFVLVIEEIASCFHSQVMSLCVSYPLTFLELKWLCVHAFVVTLSGHQSKYHNLLRQLVAMRRRLEARNIDVRRLVVNPADGLPRVFRGVKQTHKL